MLNFMDHRLKPKISCDAVCEDEYDVSNLILKVPRPFMAYSVLKPPAAITIALVCRIHLNCIKIHAKVGSLKSTAFELSSDGQILGFGKCDQETQNGVCFYTAHKTTSTPPVIPNFSHVLLKNCRKPLSNLRITIRRTRSCAPVIKRLEVWGQPAEKCSEVENLAGSSRSPILHFESTVDDSPPQEPKKEDPEGTPEDFLDAITCHIMSIPFTLPSGKVVDERTVEQCNRADAEWGRAPSDPFTGLEYTRHRRPIFNAALKARIDQFLLTNSEAKEYKDVPRTVGTYIRRPEAEETETPRPSQEVELLPVGSSFDAQLMAAVESLRQVQSKKPAIKRACQRCENKEHLYEIIKCKHFVCRNCLLGSKEMRMQCKVANCNVTFGRTDVLKYHVNR